MHEGTVNLSVSPNLTNDHELHQGVARAGLTYLTYRWRVKQGEEDNEAQAKNVYALVCMSNHPDLTSNHLQSFSSIPLSCSIVLSGLKTTTDGKHCASGKQNEHTCSLYLIH